MDVLSSFLEGPRARHAFLLRTVMDPPWSIRVMDHAPLTVVCVVAGSAAVVFDDGETIALGPGDTTLVRGPDEYVVADDPRSPPQVNVLEGQICEPVGATTSPPLTDMGVRTWGNASDGSSVVLTGTYHAESELSRPLLDALPRSVVLRASEWRCPFVPILAEEITADAPGQEAVLDRLLDLIVVAGARQWFETSTAPTHGWYQARFDPVVGPALTAIHSAPDERWTVQSLAANVGASRASLARRFTAAVGSAPITYLTEHRLALAADLLAGTDLSISVIAPRVGYSTPFALSTAFKRSYRLSPTEYRRGHRLTVEVVDAG